MPVSNTEISPQAKEKGEGRDYGRFGTHTICFNFYKTSNVQSLGAANIVCYTYQFNTGVCLLYTNNEEKLALDETVVNMCDCLIALSKTEIGHFQIAKYGNSGKRGRNRSEGAGAIVVVFKFIMIIL